MLLTTGGDWVEKVVVFTEVAGVWQRLQWVCDLPGTVALGHGSAGEAGLWPRIRCFMTALTVNNGPAQRHGERFLECCAASC